MNWGTLINQSGSFGFERLEIRFVLLETQRYTACADFAICSVTQARTATCKSVTRSSVIQKRASRLHASLYQPFVVQGRQYLIASNITLFQAEDS